MMLSTQQFGAQLRIGQPFAKLQQATMKSPLGQKELQQGAPANLPRIPYGHRAVFELQNINNLTKMGPDRGGSRLPREDIGQHRSLKKTRQPEQLDASVFPLIEVAKLLLERGKMTSARNALEAALKFGDSDQRIRRLYEVIRPGISTKKSATHKNRQSELEYITENWSQLKGKWVAIEGDQLLASDEELKMVFETLKEQHPGTRPLIHRIR